MWCCHRFWFTATSMNSPFYDMSLSSLITSWKGGVSISNRTVRVGKIHFDSPKTGVRGHVLEFRCSSRRKNKILAKGLTCDVWSGMEGTRRSSESVCRPSQQALGTLWDPNGLSEKLKKETWKARSGQRFFLNLELLLAWSWYCASFSGTTFIHHHSSDGHCRPRVVGFSL